MGRVNRLGEAGKGRLQQESQLPRPHLPKEEEKKERARTRQTNAQRHSRPPRQTKVEREGRKHLTTNTRCTPRPPPSSPAHLKGGKKKKKTQEAKLPKKFPRKGKSKAQKEQSLKGEKMSYTKRTLPQFPLSQRPKAQDTTWHQRNITPTPRLSGVGVSIDNR